MSNNVTLEKYKRLKICLTCGQKRDTDFLRCRACLQQQAEYRKKRALARLCTACPSTAAEGYKFCMPCLLKARKTNRANIERRKQSGICTTCKDSALPGKRQCAECSKRFRRKERTYTQRIKKETIDAYGGKCACCPESEYLFLCIDHVNNDGSAHRKITGGAGIFTYTWLRRNNYPTGFQVLCFNCNVGKQLNKGICPHKNVCKTTSVMPITDSMLLKQLESNLREQSTYLHYASTAA